MYHFSAAQFSELAKLTPQQKGDVELGLTLMRILWRAGAWHEGSHHQWQKSE